MTAQLILTIVLGAIFLSGITIGVIVVLLNTFAQDEVSQRLEAFATVPIASSRQTRRRSLTQFHRLRMRMNTMLSAFVSPQLSLQLVSANWPVTETEFLLIRIWSTIFLFAAGWLLFGNILPGIGLGFIAYIIPGIILLQSLNRRRMQFDKQFLDVVILIKGAVRSGYSFLQALDLVIEEMKAPASDEFRRVRREVMLGIPMSQALTSLYERMQNPDLYLVITAVNINAQTGGNQAQMLEAVTKTIRDRVRLFREVRAMTAQQRVSGYMLSFLPFIITAVLFIVNPKYISKIFEPGIFLCVPIGALIFVLLGNLIITKLAKIEV